MQILLGTMTGMDSTARRQMSDKALSSCISRARAKQRHIINVKTKESLGKTPNIMSLIKLNTISHGVISESLIYPLLLYSISIISSKLKFYNINKNNPLIKL